MICPKCKSKNTYSITYSIGNTRLVCNDCGYEISIYPPKPLKPFILYGSIRKPVDLKIDIDEVNAEALLDSLGHIAFVSGVQSDGETAILRLIPVPETE